MSSFHFGCCMACRAPFMPDTDLFYQEESQSVFYMQMRFKQLSKGVANSEFTGPREGGHLITKAKYGQAFKWAKDLDPASIVDSISGWDSDKAKMSLNKDNSFPFDTLFAAWDRPPNDKIVKHSALRDWTSETAADMKEVTIDSDFTEPVCKLCNNIFDCWARMRLFTTEMDLIPSKAITIMKQGGGGITQIPSISARNKNKQLHMDRLASLCAYYMHGSLIALVDPALPGDAVDLKTYPKLQPLLVALTWIPLHLVCLEAELREPLADEGKGAGKRNTSKGAHNYLGNIDLVIAYYMWLCAKAHDTAGDKLEFERFCVACVKEIVECPMPVWDSRLHKKLSDYLFDEAPDGQLRDRISHVSDKLVQMYREKFAPLVPLIKGHECAAGTDPEFAKVAEEYFLTGVEAKEFMSDFTTANVNPDNIKYFMDHAGISATLWQVRRYLVGETQTLREQLDKWLVARLGREWGNMARNIQGDISVDEAREIYSMQNVLRVDKLLGKNKALGSGAELSLIKNLDPVVLHKLAWECGRCSVWKAAFRLRKFDFTRGGGKKRVVVRGEQIGSRFIHAGRGEQIGSIFIHAGGPGLSRAASLRGGPRSGPA
jgi:hypothetical protein